MHRYCVSIAADPAGRGPLSAAGVLLTAGALLLAACSSGEPSAGAGEAAAADRTSVTLMTFNVENLFDTTHDEGKNDLTFLPLPEKASEQHKAECEKIEVEKWREQCLYWDWNEEVLERKLEVLAEAILQVDDGRGPDVLVLQEVENLSVLERLRTGHLGPAGYLPAVLLEGGDLRGIDVAFLTRLPVVGEPVLHRIAFHGFEEARVRDTRGILEATFELPDGELLTGYAVHFPAPFHPFEMRIRAYEFLNGLKATLPPGRLVFAAGDFNTTEEEDRKHGMLSDYAEPEWTVAHREGCSGCRGTHYYAPKDSWSFLDMILWGRTAKRGAHATWRLRAESVRIANETPDQRTPEGAPADFQLPGAAGVSDHWPLLVTIELHKKQ